MATTKTLQDTVTWAQTILGQQPFFVTNLEPALTFANLVLGKVLGPPMRWRFNRNTLHFTISTGGGTDYSQSVPFLGWIETQWLVDGSGKITALSGALTLPKTSNPGRPTQMAPVYDDNAGNITFRFNTVPTASDTVYVDYQKKAPLMTSPGSAWGPVPDEYAYIYDMLFLALAGNLTKDVRAPFWSQQGVSALLGAQTGLTAQEVAIFLGDWDRAMQFLSKSQEMTKAGVASLTR